MLGLGVAHSRPAVFIKLVSVIENRRLVLIVARRRCTLLGGLRAPCLLLLQLLLSSHVFLHAQKFFLTFTLLGLLLLPHALVHKFVRRTLMQVRTSAAVLGQVLRWLLHLLLGLGPRLPLIKLIYVVFIDVIHTLAVGGFNAEHVLRHSHIFLSDAVVVVRNTSVGWRLLKSSILRCHRSGLLIVRR